MSRRKLSPRTIASALALAASTLLGSGAHAQVNPQNTSPAATSLAVQASAAATAQSPRITSAIDDTVRVTLKGNVHPLAQARYDQGSAPASMPTGRLSLVLAPSAQQQQALKEYLGSLQDPASPNYHKWLTPAQYGTSYGVSEADIATVSAWLNGQGFKVEKVAAARNLIQFSGSVSQVTAAFHTPIHSFLVNGEHHYANTVDPQIPAAIAPVVAAVSPLHDFHPRRNSKLGGREVWDPATRKFDPSLTLFDSNNVPTLFVGPADAAVIYNTPNPTLNPGYTGTKYDGTGVTIGIAGDSDITLQDVANYRTLFLNDTNAAHLPSQIIDGDDPGITGDEIEALLDTEIAGAIAPGATVNLYTAANTYLANGLDLAIQRALQDNNVSILNVSFGACEASLGASGNQFYAGMWEEAAAQGISVTVSTGDSGSAGCDDPNSETAAIYGLGVNGLASTPYNIAVGGTDYLLTTANFGTYVQYQANGSFTSGSGPYYGTALSYIPETPWNDSINTFGTISQDTPYSQANISAAGGGASGVYAKPAYQTGQTPNDTARDLPDVSLLAANGLDGALWALCADVGATGNTTGLATDCQLTNGGLGSNTQVEGVGGTSAAAPAFAGMLALVTQSLGSGARLGQANDTLYKLASSAYSSVFHDVTQGNNSVPCSQGTAPSCVLDTAGSYFLSGFNAGTGFDLASGLGSVNAASMVSHWPGAGLTASSVSLTANGGTSALNITHGANVTFAVAATPSAATGDVSINTTSGLTNNGNATAGTLSGGAASITANTLPGGSYNIYAYYGGDASYANSTSNSIPVTVGKENSTTKLYLDVVDPSNNSNFTNTTIPYGYYGYIDSQPYGNASQTVNGNLVVDGYPTGTVSLAGLPTTPSVGLNSTGFAEYPIYSLVPGTYSVTAQYSGDVSFNPSSSSAQGFSVTMATTALQVTPAQSISSASSATVTVTLFTDSVGNFPTGVITLTGNNNTFSATPVQGYVNTGEDGLQSTFTVPGSALAAGVNTLTATYAGDGNYSTSSITTTVTITTTPSFTLAGPGSTITIAAPGGSGTGTITLTPQNGFTGPVALSCSVAFTSTGAAPTCSLNPTSVTLSGAPGTATLTVGTTASTALSYPLGKFFAGGGVALGCVLLFGIPARRRSWRGLLALVLLLGGIGALGLTGCGGSGNSGSGGGGGTTGTPAGSYTATVTGTAAGNVVASTTVTVTVQ